MKRKFFRVLIALVLVLSFSLVMATPAVAADITSISVTPLSNTAGATTDYSIAFTPTTGEATDVEINFDAFGTTATDMDLSAGSITIGDYTFGGFSVDPTAVTFDNNAKTITFTGGTTQAAVEHTIVNGSAGTGLVITNDQDAETQDVTISTTTDTGTVALTIDPDVLDHFTVVPDNLNPVVAETVTLTVTAEDQFDNTLTTYSESLFLSQTGAGTPALIAWSGADVTDYGDGTGRFTGTWTNAICTVDVSYTIAAEAVTLKVTGDSTGKTASSAAVTWQSVDILTIVGTTYQNGNDTILITFGTEVQPADMGPWDAAVFALVKCGTVDLSLVGAIFTPASGLTDTLTITLDEAVAYLVNGETVYVTPALEAIKGTGDNFVPNTEQASAAPVSGDTVAPTVALTYNPDREVKNADTLTITATFSEAMQATPQIAIDTPGTDLVATDMSGSGASWTYSYDVPAGSDGTADVTIAGFDLAGNAFVSGGPDGTFVIDNTVPTIPVANVVGLTTNGGAVDTITITFSEPVVATDADFTDGNEVAGITLKKTGEADVTVDLTGATFAYAGSDLTITLAETGNVPDYLINGYTVTFDPSNTNTIEDGAVNLLDTAAIVGTDVIGGDSGAPAMAKVVGMIKTGDDTVTITFSEAVVAADGTWSADEFGIESPASAPLNIDHASFAMDATNTILTITLNQATDGAFLVMNDQVKVTPETGAVLDLAGNLLPTTPATGAAIADPAAPYITSIVGTTIQDAGDTIIIAFSEAVEPADETWSANEFTITGLTLTNATFAPATGFTIALTITLDEAEATDAAYLVNGDNVLVTPAASAIEDASGNPVPDVEVESAAVVSGDTVAPTIVSIAGTIVPGTAQPEERDIIRIDFSEAVVPDDATWSDNEFTITGAGVDLASATFAPASGITTTLTITLLVTNPLTAGTLTVTPVVDEVVDLAGNKMSVVDSTATVQAPTAAFVINLAAGYNLISLPLVPTDADIEAVLAGLVNANTVIQVRAYNASDGTWGIWASTGSYADNPTLTEMNDGLGFWIEMSTGDNLVASGSELPAPPLTPPSYSVYEGWNLIGFKSLALTTEADVYLGPAVTLTVEVMLYYDAAGGTYTLLTDLTTDLLVPGYGYWLAVNADGTIYP